MKPQRLVFLGVLAASCLTGTADAQYYPSNAYNPYAAYNPYNYYPPNNACQGYNYQPYTQQAYRPQAYNPQGYAAQAYNSQASNPQASTLQTYYPQTYNAQAYERQAYYASYPQYGYQYSAATVPAAMSTPQQASAAPSTPAPRETAVARPLTSPAPSLSTPTTAEPGTVAPERGADDPPKKSEAAGDPELLPQQPRLYPGDAGAAGDCGLHLWGSGCGDGDLGRFYMDVGFILLQPRWNDNVSYLTRTAPIGAAARSGSNDFAYDWVVTPRFELGMQGEGGLGFRLRYEFFDQLAHDSITRPDAFTTVSSAAPLGINQVPGVGESAQIHSRLNLHVVDAEALQEFRWSGWSLRGSAGVRYAYLQQNYDWLESNLDGTNDALVSFRRFGGAGPTLALEARRVLSNANLSLYAIGRGSLLFGRFYQRVDNFNSGALIVAGRREEEDLMPVGELEAGVEWSYSLGRSRLVIATGVFGQVWFGAGNSSDSSPVFNTQGGNIQFDSNAQSRQNLGFLGWTLTAGIQF